MLAMGLVLVASVLVAGVVEGPTLTHRLIGVLSLAGLLVRLLAALRGPSSFEGNLVNGRWRPPPAP